VGLIFDSACSKPKSYFQTLYTYPDNFRAFKALIAAQYSGAQVKIADNFVFGETNTTKDFLAKFPSGKVRHGAALEPPL
jgi:elongation factor 1-gamma